MNYYPTVTCSYANLPDMTAVISHVRGVRPDAHQTFARLFCPLVIGLAGSYVNLSFLPVVYPAALSLLCAPFLPLTGKLDLPLRKLFFIFR